MVAINNAGNYEYFSKDLEGAPVSAEDMHETVQLNHENDLPYLNETLHLEDRANALSAMEGIRTSAGCAANPGRWNIIWNRIINSQSFNTAAAWQWRNYTGNNPHDKHMHYHRNVLCTGMILTRIGIYLNQVSN